MWAEEINNLTLLDLSHAYSFTVTIVDCDSVNISILSEILVREEEHV